MCLERLLLHKSVFIINIWISVTEVLFVATKTVLRYFQLTDLDDRGTSIPVENTKDVIAVDYDPLEGYVYWADKSLSIIARAKLNGSGK